MIVYATETIPTGFKGTITIVNYPEGSFTRLKDRRTFWAPAVSFRRPDGKTVYEWLETRANPDGSYPKPGSIVRPYNPER